VLWLLLRSSLVDGEIGVSGSEENREGARSRALEEEAASAGEKLQRVLSHTRRRMVALNTPFAGLRKGRKRISPFGSRETSERSERPCIYRRGRRQVSNPIL
jgi:hypothetical protein